MSKKPRIGISLPKRGGFTQNLAVRLAVKLAGGVPVNLLPSKKKMDLKGFNGLIITGGTDINPALYESDKIKKDYLYDDERDAFESSLIEQAMSKKVPLFCICRGAQLLNVIQDGDLYEDITEVFKNSNYPTSLIGKIFFRKKIFLEKDSALFNLIQGSELMVNSMHSQSIKDIGQNLFVSAKESNGIVQAIESKNHEDHYVIGVQFHPEFLIYRKEIRGLFNNFIEVCRSRPKS